MLSVLVVKVRVRRASLHRPSLQLVAEGPRAMISGMMEGGERLGATAGCRDDTCFQCTRKSTAPTSCVTKTRLTRTKNWKAAGQRSQRAAWVCVQLAPAAPPSPAALPAHAHPWDRGTGGIQETSMQLLVLGTTSPSTAAVRQNIKNKHCLPGPGDAKEIVTPVLRKGFLALAIEGRGSERPHGTSHWLQGEKIPPSASLNPLAFKFKVSQCGNGIGGCVEG